jgi:1-acyl-sn-glycerol-3-phosphate acyltransferase
MIFKVLSVFGYMFRSMIIYSFRRAFRPKGLDRALEEDYLNWSRHTLEVFGAGLQVEGRQHLPPADGRRLVVVSNHQSQLDIPALVAAVDRRLGFVAKKELGAIPLLNYWMKQIGCVIIDRTDRAGAHRALETAAQGMGSHPLVVFPEGTRSKDGSLLPLKMGGFRLALLAGARLLPVHIEGTRDAGENRAKCVHGPNPVKVRLIPALETQGCAEGKAALNRIRDYVDACWRTPAGEPDPVPPILALTSGDKGSPSPIGDVAPH